MTAWFRIRKRSPVTGVVLGLVLAGACLVCVPRAADATITYVYDSLGRLTGVIDPAQGTAL